MKSNGKRSVIHSTFTIERTFDASPERVFAAFAQKENKSKWFSGPPEWGPDKWEMDFRVGGKETSIGGPPGGPVYSFSSHYLDIVANDRIIYSYVMHMDDAKISASQATIELKPDGKNTRLTLTEYGAYLDGHDTPGAREEGTRALFDKLAKTL